MSVADHIRTTGSAVTIVTGLILTVVFLAKLDGRVARLEEQAHTLAPSVATTVREVAAATSPQIPNTVAQACVDLAKRNADEIGKGFLLSSDRIQKTMSDMGCTRSP